MPTWPSFLPDPTLEGYSYTPVDGVARTDMENGAPRARRRFTSQPTMTTVNWVFTEFQFGVFEAWYKYYLLDGAQEFDAYMKTGKGRVLVNCKFAGAWSQTLLAPNSYRVSATLMILNRPVMTSSQIVPYL